MAEFEPALQFVIRHEGEGAASASSNDIKLCSECFQDQGLRLDAGLIGVMEGSACPNCGSTTGRKLNEAMITVLARRFFVWGTLTRCKYGAAPRLQFNQHQSTCISVPAWLEPDMRLIGQMLRVGFFYYGPRLWMVGEVEPLKALRDPATRGSIVSRIIAEYPAKELSETEVFYRIRRNPERPADFREYDSPPNAPAHPSRLDSPGFPVMYASQDLQVCLHECRVTADDEIFVATLAPRRKLRLLDLTELLREEGVTEFESLDMAIHMLFLAGEHSYEIARGIAQRAAGTGYDGLVYPSYFSLLRTGAMPFETSFGISHRRFPGLTPREKAKIVGNLALFGRPVEDSLVSVRCINRLLLNRVEYGTILGPVGV